MNITDCDNPIDIVIPWVDGNDPAWLAEKSCFSSGAPGKGGELDDAPARYRDTGILKYLFRSIDLYMPWIRTIHFVTWGHLPEWINPKAEKLHIVKHEDFIPTKYLPTFSSHTIELNIHRIPGLAEQFIYFNDDLLVLRSTKPTDFFRKGLPVDFAVETALTGKFRHSICGVQLSNAEIINQNFNKRTVIHNNLLKWFCLRNGTSLFRTLALLPWPRFSDFLYNHTANPFLKSTFEEVWAKEYLSLDETCRHRFRCMNDPNQWLMRDWQLVSGRFIPGPVNKSKSYLLTDDLTEIKKAVTEKRHSVICINDVSYQELKNYTDVLEELNECIKSVFPLPCNFEKAIFDK